MEHISTSDSQIKTSIRAAAAANILTHKRRLPAAMSSSSLLLLPILLVASTSTRSYAFQSPAPARPPSCRRRHNLFGVCHSRKASSASFLLSSKRADDGDDSWYDDYDDFVQKLDFENQGGWDSGADAPFDDRRSSAARGRDNSSDNSRGGRRAITAAGRFGGLGGAGGGRRNSSFREAAGVGHDYTRDPNDNFGNTVDENAVNDLLSTRLQYRKRKLFDEADDIRDELLNVHGVTVWDKDLLWTTTASSQQGGGRGQRDRDRGGRGGRMREGRIGGRSGRGGGGRGGRDRQFNEFGHDYTQVGGPIDSSLCTLSENEIHSLIRERMECKFARDFRVADQIEQELMRAGVDVHDGFKEWRADGQGWGRRSSNRDNDYDGMPRAPKIYQQRGPGKGLSKKQIDEINALVAERSGCKAESNFNRADEIFRELSDRYKVNVDDRNAEWSLLSEEYLLSPETTLVPEEKVQAEIVKKLGQRILARKARNFDLADDIRDDLLRNYLVEVDDRSKEWLVLRPAGARWANDDDVDVDGDETNFVSKEEWDGDVSFESSDDDFDDELAAEENRYTKPTQVGFHGVDLSSMTVPELKEKLRVKGLPVSGKKSELIERLMESA